MSAGTLSDAFTGAVERVVRLHQTQVYGEFCSTEDTSEAQLTSQRHEFGCLTSVVLVEFSSVVLTRP